MTTHTRAWPGPRAKLALRALLGLSVATLVVVGFFGFLHTKAGRPWMARLGMGCPVGKITPAQAVVTRERGMADLRGDRPAPSRAALGFVLDQSTDADVRAWAARAGVGCKEEARGFRILRCQSVPARALGEDSGTTSAESVTFALAENGTLLSVDVLRRDVPGARAAELYGALTSRLTRELGAPTKATALPTGEYLAGGPMHTAVSTWRFEDYLATVTAMNLGDRGGIVVREQYGSARKPSM